MVIIMVKKTTLPAGIIIEGCTAQGNGPYDPQGVLRDREYCSLNCRSFCVGPEHCFKVVQAEAAGPLERYISNKKV
jgi:hypothetical protein